MHKKFLHVIPLKNQYIENLVKTLITQAKRLIKMANNIWEYLGVYLCIFFEVFVVNIKL